MKTIIKSIAFLLIVPFALLLNLFGKRKDSIVEYEFSFTRVFMFVKCKTKDNEVLDDDLVIMSFIFLLARYFYICDDRQILPMRDALIDIIRNEAVNSYENIKKIYSNIFNSFSASEKKAMLKLFPFGLVPLLPSTEEISEKPIGKYSFIIYGNDSKFRHRFFMHMGPDMILLPCMVAAFYMYTQMTLKTKDKIERLNTKILQLLERNANDCRSFYSHHTLPVEVMNNES